MVLFFQQLWALWARSALVWRHGWRKFLLMRVFEPSLTLYGLGFGLGLAYGEVGGYPYLNYVVPGIICTIILFGGFMDGAFGTIARQIYQGTWSSQLSTGLTVRQILIAESFWIGFKALMSGFLVLLVGYAFGGVDNLFVSLFILPILMFGGAVLTALGQVIASTARSYEDIEYIFPLIVTPMFVFGGIFIPRTSFPEWLQMLMHVYPVTYIVDSMRAIMLGTVEWPTFMLWLAALVGFYLLFHTLAHRQYVKRMLD